VYDSHVNVNVSSGGSSGDSCSNEIERERERLIFVVKLYCEKIIQGQFQ